MSYNTRTLRDNLRTLREDYARWLRDRTVLREVSDDWVMIATPYLDRHKCFLQYSLRRDGDSYLLTDGGAVFYELAGSGVPMESQKCQDLMVSTAADFGVLVDVPLLAVRATNEDFPQKADSLVRAMQAVEAMLFYTCRHTHVLPSAAGSH